LPASFPVRTLQSVEPDGRVASERPVRYATNMLLFKKRFLPAIIAAEKTQTIRLWKWRRMRAGQRSYIPGAGYITVDAVDDVRLDALTDDDARPDGFDTADALRAELETLYPEQLKAGYRAYRVTFHLLQP